MNEEADKTFRIEEVDGVTPPTRGASGWMKSVPAMISCACSSKLVSISPVAMAVASIPLTLSIVRRSCAPMPRSKFQPPLGPKMPPAPVSNAAASRSSAAPTSFASRIAARPKPVARRWPR